MPPAPVPDHSRPASLPDLFLAFTVLALQGFGGVLAVVQREMVERKRWLTQAQFNDSIAQAQAAPGPNVLFVALMGWHVGMNAGSTTAAFLGVAVTMVGIMLPSTVFTYQVAQWGHRNRDLCAVRAFKQGMTPVVIATLLSTAWILASSGGRGAADWPLWALTLASCLVMWRTRLHLLWLLGAGALLGALGVV